MLCPSWPLKVHVPALVIELFRKKNGTGLRQLSGMHKLLGSISEPHMKIHTNQQQSLNTEAKTEYD